MRMNQEWEAGLRAELAAEQEVGTTPGPKHPTTNLILSTWQDSSPKMFAQLKSRGVERLYADVLVIRMWKRMDELKESGMPAGDARMQAEREILMMDAE